MKLGVKGETGRDLWIEFGFEAVSSLYVLAVVALCWSRPGWLSLLLAAGLCAQISFWRTKADAATMMVAALLGAPSEILCVKTGVWTYYAPGLIFGIPIWIPLVWAYLLCLFRRLSISINSFTLGVWPTDNSRMRKHVYRTAAGLVLVYCLVALAVIRKSIAVAYAIPMILAIIFWHAETDIIIFLVGAAIGTLGEGIFVKLGFWQYHYPFFQSLGIPISLPLAWGISSVVVGRIASMFAEKEPAA